SGGNSGGSGGSSGGSGGNTDGGTNSGGNAGEGGMGGMGGDGNCVSDLPTITVADPFSASDFDDVDLVEECPNLLATASWPIEANDGMTQFTLDFVNSADVDFTGKQLNLTISLVEDVRGPSATGGGYDIVVGATDADDYTEVTTPFNDNEFYSTGTLNISFPIPDDNNDFDATDVYKAFVRIVSKHWGTGDPVFDYETATFEISEFSITDAP